MVTRSKADLDRIVGDGDRLAGLHGFIVFSHMLLESGKRWLLPDVANVFQLELSLFEHRKLESTLVLFLQLGVERRLTLVLIIKLLKLLLLLHAALLLLF